MKDILVSGANRGIGLELCRQLAARGDRVVGVCRRSSEALSGIGVDVIDGIDVTDPSSIRHLADRLGDKSVDWLINNAGVLGRDSLDELDFEEIEWQFRVNSIGPLRLTQALLPMLKPGSSVGIVTSRMGSIGDNTSGGYYGYRMSKAAVNMAGASLARDLASRNIAVALLHPGMVATEMTGGNGVPVEHAAQGLIARMDELDMESSGSFWHAEGQNLPW
ncbi:MAG: SDR family oxidoreductase [Xanthomonadales bacterium]|nr:SDR family oxidoreductase [Xanthomonadales bacterium]NNL95830.1 SDR family oxidoreductase [Xanthomonadales bacterium]